MMFDSSCNPRNGYFLVDMPLRYVAVLSELTENLRSLWEKFSAMWMLAPRRLIDVSATTISKFSDCKEMGLWKWLSSVRI